MKYVLLLGGISSHYSFRHEMDMVGTSILRSRALLGGSNTILMYFLSAWPFQFVQLVKSCFPTQLQHHTIE